MPILQKNSCISGRVLGDFVIRHKIGEEASGEVFLAHQISLSPGEVSSKADDRLVALKVFPKTSLKADTSLKEARILTSLNHPNLVSVLAVGEEEGICFIVMDYIEGISLRSYLKTKRFIPVDKALYIIQQAAEALHFAWTEKQIIHKDIKPDNIMLSEDCVAKVSGFGFAFAAGEGERGAEKKIDMRSEIYSLGIILYQMLTGELPLTGSLESIIIRQHLYKPSENIPSKQLKTLKKVGLLVSKMLEKNPEKRYQSMEYFIKEIAAVRKLTAQNKGFISFLHFISFKKADSGITRELPSTESGKTNLNFLYKVAEFTGMPIFLRRIFRSLRVTSETPKRLGIRLCGVIASYQARLKSQATGLKR